MTYRKINRLLGELTSNARYDAIELARTRLKARAYPRNSRGYASYEPVMRAINPPTLTFAQWRAVYALAASSLK